VCGVSVKYKPINEWCRPVEKSILGIKPILGELLHIRPLKSKKLKTK
jgi:hypothetical protein